MSSRIQRLLRFAGKNKFAVAFFVSISVAPHIFWPRQLLAQGDDGALYFLDPKGWLKSSFQQVQLYYADGIFTAPTRTFALFINFLNLFIPSVSVLQKTVFGLSLALGFVGFYLLLGRVNETTRNSPLIRCSLSMLVCFSPLLYQSYFAHLLLAMYIPAIVGPLLYLSSKFIDTGSKITLVGVIAVAHVGGFLYFALPWLLPIIVIVPFVFLLTTKQRGLDGFVRTCLVGLAVLGPNLWMIPQVLEDTFSAPIHVRSIASGALRQDFQSILEFLQPSLVLAIRVIPYNIANLNYFWNVYLQITSFVFLLALVGLLLRTVISRMGRNLRRRGFLPASAALAMSAVWLTPGSIPGTDRMLIFVMERIPILSVTRNFQDKVVPAFLISLALWISVCLPTNKDLFSVLQRGLLVGPILLMSVFTVVGANLHPRFTDGPIKFGIQQINSDYQNLMGWLDSRSIQKPIVLQIPLSRGNWTAIQDEYDEKMWFVGVSPLSLQSKGSDLKGISPTYELAQLTGIAENLVLEGVPDLNGVIDLAHQAGADYVLFIRNIPQRKNISLSTFYPPSPQIETIIGSIPENERTDFGRRYTILRIDNQSESARFGVRTAYFLQPDGEMIAPEETHVVVDDRNDLRTRISFEAGKGFFEVVYKQPFDPRFSIESSDGRRYLAEQSTDGWTMWKIKEDIVRGDNSSSTTLDIVFRPRISMIQLTNWFYWITLGAVGMLLVSVCVVSVYRIMGAART